MSRRSANFAAFPVLAQDSQGPQEVTWADPRQPVESSCIRQLALIGTNLSQQQWKLLETHFREVVLMLDGDATGQRATQVLSARWPAVRVAGVPASCQPDQLSPEEIQGILGQVKLCPEMTAALPSSGMIGS
jgi:hypothetical protein